MEADDVLAEFSSLLETYEINDEDVRQALTGTVRSMLDDSHWRQLDEQALAGLLYQGISLYGKTNWERLAQIIAPLYLYAMEHIPVETRSELQGAIRQRMEANDISANALLPFIFLEMDKAVVSTAALDFAMVPAPPEDDAIGWPKRLISDLEAGMGSNKGALFGGLVTLGDRRVNELLSDVKWLISDSEIGTAIKCFSGMPTVAAFEFWLEWAEELVGAGLENTGLFGQVSSGLLLLIRSAKTDTFSEITRNFGYLHLEDGTAQPLTVHGEYSKAELAERYANRMYALEAAESPPKLTSDVIRQLGLEPKALLEERFTMQ